jgi:hypothetical protein
VVVEEVKDIVTRLRRWAIETDSVPASDLMDEAAAEIERLRNGAVESRETVQCPHVVGKTTLHCSLTPFTLTDAERAAIGWAIMECESMPTTLSREAADTLRSLLERL